ncbi:MAG: pyridoxamine 5'-phosphate oxidase family protein, partial [Hyphomicrobiaceae bacterium]
IDWFIIQIFRGHIGMKHELNETILEVLSQCVDLTIAAVRPDGVPQATVVSFVHDGLLLYFACAAVSQKASDISNEPRYH